MTEFDKDAVVYYRPVTKDNPGISVSIGNLKFHTKDDKRGNAHYTTCWHCGHDRFTAQGMGYEEMRTDIPRPTVSTQFEHIMFYWIRCLKCDIFRKIYSRAKTTWVVKNQCVNRN